MYIHVYTCVNMCMRHVCIHVYTCVRMYIIFATYMYMELKTVACGLLERGLLLGGKL